MIEIPLHPRGAGCDQPEILAIQRAGRDIVMRIDARTLPSGETIETEVCIVGTGAAGLTLAREFIGQGFRVCVLESGGLGEPDPDTVSLAEVETASDFVQVTPDRRNRRFGGNSTYWAINIAPGEQGPRLCPLDEVDFEHFNLVRQKFSIKNIAMKSIVPATLPRICTRMR